MVTNDLDMVHTKARDLAQSLRVISNPHRLMILCTIGDQEKHVNHLVDKLNLSQPSVSQHLAVLRDQGILTRRRDGQKLYYSIKDSQLLDIISYLCDNFCCDE